MAKVFATSDKCLLLKRVCDILNAVFNLARDARHLALCAILGFVCKVLEKIGKVTVSQFTIVTVFHDC